MESSLQPLANHLLVAIPERYTYHHTKGQDGVLIKTVAMTPGLAEQIEAGYGDIPFELDEDAERTLVREGQVLAVPPALTEELYVCAGPNEKPRTGADIIYSKIRVGDTLHLDSAYLTDENEIQPSIYRLPYTAAIAIIEELPNIGETWITPVGGYALLSRVYPDGAELQEDGSYAVEKNGLWQAVGPIANEGIVQEISILLGPYRPYPFHLYDRVLFEGYPRLETIRGTEYIVVQQDTIAAVLESKKGLPKLKIPSLHIDNTTRAQPIDPTIDFSEGITLVGTRKILPLASKHYDA